MIGGGHQVRQRRPGGIGNRGERDGIGDLSAIGPLYQGLPQFRTFKIQAGHQLGIGAHAHAAIGLQHRHIGAIVAFEVLHRGQQIDGHHTGGDHLATVIERDHHGGAQLTVVIHLHATPHLAIGNGLAHQGLLGLAAIAIGFGEDHIGIEVGHLQLRDYLRGAQAPVGGQQRLLHLRHIAAAHGPQGGAMAGQGTPPRLHLIQLTGDNFIPQDRLTRQGRLLKSSLHLISRKCISKQQNHGHQQSDCRGCKGNPGS